MEPKIWVDSSVKYFHQVPLLCTVSLLVLAYTKQGFEGVGLCQDKAHKLMVQGWRQAVWQEVVHARRCCSRTGIDPVSQYTVMEAGSLSRQKRWVQDGSGSGSKRISPQTDTASL